MFVNEVNDVKIYNLSAGKSVPEWLIDRRKRSKLLKKVDSRRQIELIQDFNMPGVSTSIRMSPDMQYIIATGTYKPRVKCFEVCNLSIKFEHCFDSEVSTFEVISEDFRKMVFLHCDRFLEIHADSGRHYRVRIPRFGRDMKYHKPTCDLFIVGTTRDIYRLNLERGQFLQPYVTNSSCLNACDINPEHHLLLVGSKEGTIEAWDPRTQQRCATLDVAIKLPGNKQFPSVTALNFKNGLQMGVGTATGHVLLYDIRSREPLYIKDHLNKLPIKRLAFNPMHQTVYSLDEAMLKLWDENTGKQVAYIETATTFNDFCTIPNTGMFFLAQEDIKMLTYYVPAMGPAPRWCSFLDNLTEEIESEVVENIYDDYQFVTEKELSELGLDNLIGTNLLKAYMHGFFMDVRLYNKAKAVVEPFAFERFRKEKIRQEIEKERKSRLQIESKLPRVNQELALKLMEDQANTDAAATSNAENLSNTMKATKASKQPKTPNLLQDQRFKAMFENVDFTINKNAEEYKFLAPVIKRLDKSKVKELKKRVEVARVVELHAEEAVAHEDSDNDEDLFGFDKNEDSDNNDEQESSDDENEKEFRKDMKKAYKDIKRQRQQETEDEIMEEEQGDELNNEKKQISFGNDKESASTTNENKKLKFKMQALHNIQQLNSEYANISQNLTLQERIQQNEQLNTQIKTVGNSRGNRQMTFKIEKKPTKEMKKRAYEMKKHREERKRVIRPINSLKLKKMHFK